MPVKKEIRKEYLAKRMALTQQQQHYYLAVMLEQFQKCAFPQLNYVLSYIPMTGRNEVTTQYFEEALRDLQPGYQLCFPKTDFTTASMIVIADEPGLETMPNLFGVTEPVGGNMVDPALLDVILVPMVAFDRSGYRVGYGKGFYDRFIPQCRKNVVTVGLSFFEPVDEITDAGIFDVPLKYCITPQQLYEF